MPLIKPAEAINAVKKTLAITLSDQQIEHVNNMLKTEMLKYACGDGSSHTIISKQDIPGSNEKFPLKLLAIKLADAGWKALYKYEQREGEWIVVELPKVEI